MTNKTNRNEVKTRLSDEVYAGLLLIKKAYGFPSESATLAFIVERGLFGMVSIKKEEAVDRQSSASNSDELKIGHHGK